MFEYFPKIKVLNFFDVSINCKKLVDKKVALRKYLLPSFSKYLNQEDFAKVHMAYKASGLFFHFEVK